MRSCVCCSLTIESACAAARSVRSLPPCGGELERGVATSTAVAATPLPNPPSQGGREKDQVTCRPRLKNPVSADDGLYSAASTALAKSAVPLLPPNSIG